MRYSLDEPVSVVFYYNASTKEFKPHLLSWHGRDYRLGKTDFYHKTKNGTKTLHHFSMSDLEGSIYFKLACDSDNLQWVIEEFMPASEMSVGYGVAG